jgi:hypothetical protein
MRTNQYNPIKENKTNALRIYKEEKRVLKKYFSGETNLIINQNVKMVLNGLENIIMLKEKELNALGGNK